jgi:hypothetical protein
LSPQIISPTELQTILLDVNKQLPLGWKIPANDLWVLYREATVTVAVTRNAFRLFVEISIYDHAQQFNLFKVIRLPKATENGTYGVRFSNLPNFLAVSPNLDTFIELQNTDMRHCREFDKQLRRFHMGLNKRGSRKSCAIALFTEDKKQIQGTCQTEFMAWKGPEVAYLEKNRWAFSAIGPHDVVFSCPKSVPNSPPRTLKLPAIAIFEVPPGCAAQTEDWIFPASLDGQTETILTTLNIPHLVPFPSNLSFSRNAAVFELPRADLSQLNHISDNFKNKQASLRP